LQELSDASCTSDRRVSPLCRPRRASAIGAGGGGGGGSNASGSNRIAAII
jgi:hypothetical protein